MDVRLKAYKGILKYRKTRTDAAVDTHGAEVLAKKYHYKFWVLVSLLLSSQTKDELTAEAVNNLVEAKVTP